MITLLLRLQGPMQSWGIRSRFTERDGGSEPSKSGVLGLLCAALGRERSAPIADLAALRMGVRVDREGRAERDFQTAGGGSYPGQRSYGVLRASGAGGDTVVSQRHYLADAAFLVGLEAPEPALLREIHAALRDPRWPLFLGRKGYVPSPPPFLADGLREQGLADALRSYPCLLSGSLERSEARRWPRRCVIECAAGQDGDARMDVPISFALGHRLFGERRVCTTSVDVGTEGGA